MDMSNKSLALILITSIVISIGGTFTALLQLDALQGGLQVVTGRAETSNTAATNVTVNSQLTLTFTIDAINFGGGFANGSTCRLNSSPVSPNVGNCSGFRDANNSLILQNDGNTNVTLNFSFDKTPATWIGGTSPYVKYEAFDNETGACNNGTSSYGKENWTNIPTTANAEQRVCKGSASRGRFAFDDSKDAISINFFINVTSDAPSDSATSDLLTMTAQGSDADANDDSS